MRGAGEVCGALEALEVAALEAEGVMGGAEGALGGEHDEAAGLCLAVEDGRGTFEDVDFLEGGRVGGCRRRRRR